MAAPDRPGGPHDADRVRPAERSSAAVPLFRGLGPQARGRRGGRDRGRVSGRARDRPPGRDRHRVLHRRRRPGAGRPDGDGRRAPGPGRVLRGAVGAGRRPARRHRSWRRCRRPASRSRRGTSSGCCAKSRGWPSRCSRSSPRRLREVTTTTGPERAAADRRGLTPEPPTGTVTFLFTDIEGSTRLVEALGTAAWRAAARARTAAYLHAAIAAHGGVEFGTEGDAFFVAFPTRRGGRGGGRRPARARRRPLAGRRQIRVRMGVHTGEASSTRTATMSGIDVHRAARIEAAAHGGQVLLSEADARPSPAPPRRRHARDLGDAPAQGPARPERIYQLVVDGLPGDFPAIRSLDARPNNLPTQLTAFVGRDRELGRRPGPAGRRPAA